MPDLDSFSRTLATLYQAGSDPDNWNRVLEDVCGFTGGDRAVFVHGSRDKSAIAMATHDYDPDLQEAYNTRLYKQDPWWRPSFTHPPLTVLHAQEIIPNTEIEHTEYYREMFVRGDMCDAIFSCICTNGSSEIGMFGVHRRFGNDFFNEKNRTALQMLVPHIANALAFCQTLDANGAKEDGNGSLMRVVIDEHHTVQRLDGVLDEDDNPASALFSVKGGKLFARFEHNASRYEEAVSVAIRNGRGDVFLIRNPAGDLFRLRIAPVPQSGLALALPPGQNHVIVQVDDLADGMRVAARRFAGAFDLTKREGQLLETLTESMDLREAAEQMNIKYETARWHLKTILQKSDCRNQVELLVRVAQLGK